MFISFNNI